MTDDKNIIEHFWNNTDSHALAVGDYENLHTVLQKILTLLDQGQIRVSEKTDQGWITHDWIKKAILLYFRHTPSALMTHDLGPHQAPNAWYDKVPLKTQGWTDAHFSKAGFRAVPGAVMRLGAYIGPQSVIMPSFINIGAHIGASTMVDTWATIGSCAQIGQHCHISGGVGIGGVLEPVQAHPVIIEDNCFIGARSEIAEGVIVEEGAVISMGVFLSASTKIIDRQTGALYYGRVPAYSVVVPGSTPSTSVAANHPNTTPLPTLNCAVIIKRVDEKTRSKTGINELLRH